jgi:Reverse transcriptase (RNA-dependent DNA polymerase)
MEKGKQIQQEQQPKIEEVVDEEEPRNRMTLPLKENKMGVYIKLLETDVWIHKTNITMELAIEENSKKQDKTDKQLVPVEYHKYLDIFSEEKAHHFSESRPWDHKIEMKEDFEPKSFKNYNLTPAEQLELDKFLKENLKKGYIWPSQLLMASPFFFVSKKDGKLQPCQDYRYLNDWMVKNSYPLPLILEIMDKLKGAKYFTKLDVRWGYNSVQIRKEDKWKAVFKTNKGLFEPTVMFFRMCNSPATFQAMMDDIFMTIIDNRLVIVYMDDILIFANTKEELEQITKLVLENCKNTIFF